MSDCKNYYYLKLKDNFFDRPEIKAVESMQSGYEYICIMQKMYLRSLEREGKLMLTDTIPYDITMLSSVLGHKQETIKTAIEVFDKLGLCALMSDKSIYMTEIQNFIGKSSSEGDRKRKYRAEIEDKKKQIGQSSGQMSDKHPLELELKIELEKDIDKKLESHKCSSFIKPSPEEVQEYLNKIKCTHFTGQYFIDRQDAGGWMVGKNKMKDWKATCRYWNHNNFKTNTQQPESKYKDTDWVDKIFRDTVARGITIDQLFEVDPDMKDMLKTINLEPYRKKYNM